MADEPAADSQARQGEATLTAGKLLARNAFLSLVGLGAPLAVALVAIPLLLAGMGVERFGLLTLAFVVLGYFGLFDLGLGRALTKLVADALAEDQSEAIPNLAWTASALLVTLGIVLAGVGVGLAHWVTFSLLRVSPVLRPETYLAFLAVAMAIPVVTVSAGLRGVLEAHQRFGMIMAVRVPVGILTFLVPLAVLRHTNRLDIVVGALVGVRLIALVIYGGLCSVVVRGLWQGRPSRALVRPLVSFGQWLAVSNVVGPTMQYMDRFVLGATVSATVVAYYTTPYEILSKLLIVPGALVAVLFPAFTMSGRRRPDHLGRLYRRALTYLVALLGPVTIVGVLAAHQALSWWLGKDFAAVSSRAAQLLACGMAINSVGILTQALVQASGRPDVTAKLQLLELPTYVAYLWWMVKTFGVTGAALAWTVRVSLSTAALLLLARRVVFASKEDRWTHS